MQGVGVEAGKKSVAIAVTLQPVEKTLTEAEIEAVVAKIVAEMAKRYVAAATGLRPSDLYARVMLGLDPAASPAGEAPCPAFGRRFSGLRFASPENDGWRLCCPADH